MARKKADSRPVPQSQAEAVELLSDYVALERRVMLMRVAAALAIDAMKGELAKAIAELQPERDGRFAALKAWWEAGGKAVAKKNRSIDLAGAKLGVRLTPPAVKLARGTKAEDIISWLRSIRWSEARRFMRTKVELDKEAIIAGCRADDHTAQVFEGRGVTVVQTDEFFIDTGLDPKALVAEAEG